MSETNPSSSARISNIREYYRGIQGVELTTAGFLFNPQVAFEIADQLRMDLEVYPMLPHTRLSILREVAKKAGEVSRLEIPIVHGLTLNEVETLQKKHTHAKVARVHLPFSYDKRELWTAPLRTPGAMAKIRSAGWIYYFGHAANLYGVEMAERLGADINAHTNIIVGFANEKNSKNQALLNHSGNIFIENDPSYTSRFVPDPREQGDPTFMAEQLIEKYSLDGLVLGVDHMLEYSDRTGQNVLSVLQNKSAREQTRVMHIAGSNHDISLMGNEELTIFLKATANTYFTHPVKAALDFNPQQLAKYDTQQKLETIKSAAEWIMQIQEIN